MLPRRHPENLVQLLQRQFLRLRQEEQHSNPANQIPGAIPCKPTLRLKGSYQSGPGERDNEIETPRRSCGKGHADFADVQGERFGGIGEGDGAHAGGVEHFEEVHARCHHGDLLRLVFYPEREPGPVHRDG